MSEFRDLSGLPDDPEYWAALESRVLAGLDTGLHAVPAPRDAGGPAGWWSPFESRAAKLVATAIAAVVAAILLLPPRRAESAPPLLLAPTDPIGASIIGAAAPPALGSLVFPADRRSVR